MNWLWVSPPVAEFGGTTSADGKELTVWLHADPYALLDVPWGSDQATVRRGYRKAARVRHPDSQTFGGSFDELQSALQAALGNEEAQITVEPMEGQWWAFTEFVRPSHVQTRGAVVGLVFELRDLGAVPLRPAEDNVTVTYNGQALQLPIRYSRSASSVPVLLAKTAVVAESAFLALLCLALIPLLAIAIGLESYFFSDGSVPLFWLIVVGTVLGGYGALALILASAGKPVPYPRRAITRLRGDRKPRLSLPSSRS
jgi:hypothetical protein